MKNTSDSEGRPIEIVLGNKNVAEKGSQQINITQNVFNADALKEVLNGLSGLNCSDGGNSKNGNVASAAENKTSQTPQNPQTPAKRGRKPKAPRIVTDTYTYKWLNHRDGLLRLVKLYQLLIDERFKMLASDVNPEDWCALFKGEAKPFTMKWTGKQAHLRYLFKLMIGNKYISFDEKSAKQWEILGSHFVDKNGRPFDKWDKQHDPKRGAKTLQMFADVLNIATSMPNLDALQDDIQAELDEFAEFER